MTALTPGLVDVFDLNDFQGESTADKVRDVIKSSPIVIFSKTTCEFCKEAKRTLTNMNVSFRSLELNRMDRGDSIHSIVKDISIQKTVPVIYIEGHLIGGCSDLMRMEGNGELLHKLRHLQIKGIQKDQKPIFTDMDRPWDKNAAIPPLFYFPDTLNCNAVRCKALFITITAICGAVFWDTRGMHWVIAGLMVDFILSFFFGGAFSIYGALGELCACKMEPRWVAGPPKQFAVLCGITFSGIATACFFGGNGDEVTEIIGAVFCGMLAGAAGMEAFVDFCAGCVVFSFFVRIGLVRDAVYKVHINSVEEQRMMWNNAHVKRKHSVPEVVTVSTAATEAGTADAPLLTPASTVYRVKQSDLWRKTWHPIKYMQITYFLWPLSLAALAFAFRVAVQAVNAPEELWETMAYIAAIVFVLLLVLFTLRCIMYTRKVYKEWTCPLRGPTFGAIPLTVALLGSFLSEASFTAAEVFVWIGTCVLFVFTVMFVGRWIALRHDYEHVHPTWLIIPVGNFINGALLASLDEQYTEVGLALFGFALLMWIVLFAITLQKTVISHNSDDRLRGNIFIWVACPAAAAISWSIVSASGGGVFFDTISRLLYFSSAILLCCLCYTVFPHGFTLKGMLPTLSMGVHAVAFSFNAVAIAACLYDISIGTTISAWLAAGGLAAGSWLTAVYSIQTVTAIVDQRIFRPDVKWGPFSAFNRLMHETVRTMSAKLLTLAEDPDFGTNQEFLELWTLYERLHHMHSTQEDDYLFPLLNDFVPNHPVHAGDEHEEHQLMFVHINKLIESANRGSTDTLKDEAGNLPVETVNTGASSQLDVNNKMKEKSSQMSALDADALNSQADDVTQVTSESLSPMTATLTADEDLNETPIDGEGDVMKNSSTGYGSLQLALREMVAEMEEHMVWEEKNLQPIGRKYVPLELQKRAVRQTWESVPSSEWRVLTPVIVRYLPYHPMRVRWVRGVLWAMPERAQQLGLYLYHGLSDVQWIKLTTDVPELIPRIRDVPEASRWNRYY